VGVGEGRELERLSLGPPSARWLVGPGTWLRAETTPFRADFGSQTLELGGGWGDAEKGAMGHSCERQRHRPASAGILAGTGDKKQLRFLPPALLPADATVRADTTLCCCCCYHCCCCSVRP
jgi:hypothetical protein